MILCHDCDHSGPLCGGSNENQCQCGNWYTRQTYGEILNECSDCTYITEEAKLNEEELNEGIQISNLFDS